MRYLAGGLGALSLLAAVSAMAASYERCQGVHERILQVQRDLAQHRWIVSRTTERIGNELEPKLAALRAERTRIACTSFRKSVEVERRCIDLQHQISRVVRERDQLIYRRSNSTQAIEGKEAEFHRIRGVFRNACSGWRHSGREPGGACVGGYRRFPHMATWGENIPGGRRVKSPTQCTALCSANPDCVSVDYNPRTGQCFLSNKNRRSAARMERGPKVPWDYYEGC